MDILPLFSCFETLVAKTAARRLRVIAQAMLTVTGRLTMRSLARWSGQGGSYRTIQRFFAAALPWTQMLCEFFRVHLFDAQAEYLLAADATTVTKAGRTTHGLERFFSGALGKVVPGLEFFVISAIDVGARKAYPLTVKQNVRTAEEIAARRQKQAAHKQKRAAVANRKRQAKKPRGRAKGVPNKDREKLELTGDLLRFDGWLKALLSVLRLFVTVRHLALDGHFGHNQAVLMARANNLELISKLRRDAALYEPYDGAYSGRGPRRKYGARLDYENLPAKYLQKTEDDGQLETNYYQGMFLSRKFAHRLNVVIIEKRDREQGRAAHVVLFSSDLELGWEKLIDYYSLRFQIEFNFRDAKQHFGLEDFMLTGETGVENAASLSFLMVSLSAKLSRDESRGGISINDLKSRFRGIYYAVETIKLLQPEAEEILIDTVKEAIGRIGSIHRYEISSSSL